MGEIVSPLSYLNSGRGAYGVPEAESDRFSRSPLRASGQRGTRWGTFREHREGLGQLPQVHDPRAGGRRGCQAIDLLLAGAGELGDEIGCDQLLLQGSQDAALHVRARYSRAIGAVAHPADCENAQQHDVIALIASVSRRKIGSLKVARCLLMAQSGHSILIEGMA